MIFSHSYIEIIWEMALAAHSVPMFFHPLANGVGNLEVPYYTGNLL